MFSSHSTLFRLRYDYSTTYRYVTTVGPSVWPAALRPKLTSCAGGRHNVPSSLEVDLLTLKVVSESRVTLATSMPILVFLGTSVLDLGPMYVTDVRRQTRIII